MKSKRGNKFPTLSFSRMKSKRGQGVFGMSFGAIFSIILIIAFIGVAAYVIYYFVSLGNCTKVEMFYDDLKTEVREVWKSDIRTEDFEGKVPSGIRFICFGNLTQPALTTTDQDIQHELDYGFFQDRGANVFMFPPNKACDSEGASITLDNVKIDKFFCVKEDKGKATVRLKIGSRESLVTIEEP